MSNFRDLQKLRNTRNTHVFSHRNSKQLNPESGAGKPQHMGQIDIFGLGLQKELYNNYLDSKEVMPKTKDKKGHRRGNSIVGVTNYPKKDNNFISAGISIYNISMKLADRKSNPLTSRREHAQDILPQNQPFHLPRQEKTPKDIPKDIPHNPQELSRNSFSVDYPIGKGGFGKVWKVEMKRNRQIYAMKEMFKAKIVQKKSINSVMNERKILAKTRHPFLVNMSFSFQDRENLYLFLDYLDGGDLRYHIGQKRRFSEKETKFFVANLVIGLEYLARCKVIHRDIKPENIVLDSHGYARITDFGVSREFREQNYQDTSGTPGYMAPEVMCRKNHTYTADYFALGIIAYEFMLGKRPYNGKRKEIKEQIMSRQASVKLDELPFKWNPKAIDFINRLLLRNQDIRLGAKGIEEIKSHPWLSDVDWDKMNQKKLKAPFVPVSIEDDYEEYKEQISEDTIMDNSEEAMLMLRDEQVQTLFEGYQFNKLTDKKRSTSYTTNYTEENHSRRK